MFPKKFAVVAHSKIHNTVSGLALWPIAYTLDLNTGMLQLHRTFLDNPIMANKKTEMCHFVFFFSCIDLMFCFTQGAKDFYLK